MVARSCVRQSEAAQLSALADKLNELKTGLQRNDPAFCGAASAWLVEAVLHNLDNVAQTEKYSQVEDGRIKSFAMGAIRFVADQGTSDCDILLCRLNELLTTAS
jgi:hypothetical protein